MSRTITPTKEFIEALCIGTPEEIQMINPGYSNYYIQLCQTYMRSYKTSPENIQTKYSGISDNLKKMIENFVDEYNDLIPVTRTCRAGIKRPRGLKEESLSKPATPPEIKSMQKFISNKVKTMNNKQTLETVLDLLSNTISTIKMLVEKL